MVGKVIFTTPNLIFLSDKNIGLVIIADDSSRYYYNSFQNVNMRDVIVNITKYLNIKTILLDTLPSVETYYNIENKKIDTLEVDLNYDNSDKISIVKMNREDNISTNSIQAKEKDIYLSRELHSQINKNIKSNKKKIVLYAQRKGAFTQTVCSDCGETKKCKTCAKNLVLIEKKSGNNITRYYTCNSCNTRETIIQNINPKKVISGKVEKIQNTDEHNLNPELKCEYCGSWRMTTLGIGTGGVMEKVKQIYPDTPVFIIDSENVKTKKQAIKIYTEYIKSCEEKTSILIGTELIIPLLSDIDTIAVISMDSLFVIPEYTIDTQIFFTVNTLVASLSDTEKSHMFIQTRNKEKVFDYVACKKLIEFYRHEISSREFLKLPPSGVMLTYDAPIGLSIPKFLEKHMYYTVNTQNTNSKNRFIFLIDREGWYIDENLRMLCIENLSRYNLQINPSQVLR